MSKILTGLYSAIPSAAANTGVYYYATDTDVEARVIELMRIKQKDILQADTSENKQDPQPAINPVPQGQGFIGTIKSLLGLS
jgi:hypothetical protein